MYTLNNMYIMYNATGRCPEHLGQYTGTHSEI